MTQTLVRAAISNATNTRDAALWEKYKATGDIGTRNEIVMLYIRIVEIIARKMYHVFIGKAQLEDIIGNGTIALIKAVESFDPSRGIQFDTYASIRIRGSVVDYIRGQDWVPRTARDKAKLVENSYSKLRDRLSREPTYEEIADELKMKTESVESILSDVHAYNMISLEEMISDRMESSFEIEDTVNLPPQSLLLKKELRKVLGQAIDGLSEKERLVTTLFYYEGLKVKEIAEVMGISASRVCQLHSMSLIKMKVRLSDYVNMY